MSVVYRRYIGSTSVVYRSSVGEKLILSAVSADISANTCYKYCTEVGDSTHDPIIFRTILVNLLFG